MKFTRKQLISEVRRFDGVPFFHQGRSEYGVDCVGLAYLSALAVGADLKGYVDDVTYGRDPDGILEQKIAKHVRRLHPRPDPLPVGALLFFAFGKKGQHLGIVSDLPGYFIHAFEPEGRVVETRLDRVWSIRIRGVFDFYGVTD